MAQFDTILQGFSDIDLDCIEAAAADLSDRVASMEALTYSDEDDKKPMAYFDTDNIFTKGGLGFQEGGEEMLRLKLQILQLIADLFPSGDIEGSSLDFLGQGSFNTLVAVTLRPNAKRRDSGIAFSAKVSRFLGIPPKSRNFALRIPLDEDKDLISSTSRYIPRDVATQHVVSLRLALPIPKIEEYDLSSTNALGRPYNLQNLLPGYNLHSLWMELNPQQKLSAIQQITEMVDRVAALTTTAAGLVSVSNLTSANSTIALDQFPVPTSSEAKRRPGYSQESQSPAPRQTPFMYLVDHCQRWQRYEEEIGQASRNQKLWGGMIAVADALDRRGWLGQHFHLAHGDLFPRNILAEINGPATVKITGIVDWDMASFVPKVVALRPPFWAWKGGAVDESDEDVATYDPPDRKLRLLRLAFKSAASEDFIRFGLPREGAIARKLFKVVSVGLLTTSHRHLALELVEQWDSLYPEDRGGDWGLE